MLFPATHWDGIRDGTITLAFRRWKTPRAKPGSLHRVAGTSIRIDSIEPVEAASVTEGEAKLAGHESRNALLAYLDAIPEGTVYRIAFTAAGPDARIALRETLPDAAGLATIQRRLDRLDAAAKGGPWTAATLALIAEHPARRAPDLAALLGRETLPFKADVRKLKELGLTESLEVGYRISRRGRAALRAQTVTLER